MILDVAIIGHGRSPQAKCWGPKIDALDCVIRMWDCHWQGATDWGVKYNYGYFELSPRQMSRFLQCNQREPSIGWLAGHLKDTDWTLPTNTVVVREIWDWIELGKQLGGIGTRGKLKLTRGCAAACWAITQRPRTVTLVGFDNVHQGKVLNRAEGFPDGYCDLPSTGPFKDYEEFVGGTKYGNHDYVAEGAIIKTLAERNSVRLHFAQDVW